MCRPARLRSRPVASLAFGLVLACLVGAPGVGASPWGIGAGVATKRLDGEVGNLTVVIDGPGPWADAGVPFTLSASLGDAIGPFVYLWNCSVLGTTHTATWTVRLLSPGPARFSLEVGDAAGDVSSANLTVNVTAGPIVSAGPVNRSADVGVPLGVALAVREGVAPYRVQWAVDGATERGSFNLSTAGTVTEPLWANATGPVWVTANVTDAVGGADTTAAWVSLAAAAPLLALAVPVTPGEVGVPFHLTAAVVGGTPPITWVAGALGPVANATAARGMLDGAGTVSWNATPTAAGVLPVWVTTLDALGVARSANGSLNVVAPVNESLVVLNRSVAAGATVNVSALVGGGLPPYTLDWTASDGAHGSGALGAPGPVNWTVPAFTAGFLAIELTVRDAAQGSISAASTVLVAPVAATPAPSPPARPNDDAITWVAGLALSGGAVGVAGWWWRGRRRGQFDAAMARRARADRFVAEAIQARNGIDADDLLGLGDAQSLFPGEVAEAVDRLVAAGRVRAEFETGDPVYYWGGSPAEGTPEPPDRSGPTEEP